MTSASAPILLIVPFLGVLASFALLPGLAPRFWHRRMDPVIFGWVAAGVALTALGRGPKAALRFLWEASFADFLPFIAVLLALYALGGGILIAGGPWGRPAGNLLLLIISGLAASVMGTIGAVLLFIHPLLAANGARPERRHLVLAFIILAGNAGGALSPLGDPPLLVGFLHGVPFSWPAIHLALPLLVIAVPVLALCYGIDVSLARREPKPGRKKLRLRGRLNIVLMLGFVTAIALAGVWRGPEIVIWHAMLPASQLALTALAFACIGVSERHTAPSIRARNRFAWGPMREISILFFAIFATIRPVLNLLVQAPLAPGATPLWFWLAGLCSAFLDAAPTYLIFFQAAGGDAARLAAPPSRLLAAIAAGAVFFGPVTYLGNAPNLMVRAIAARRGVRMPGFVVYMVAASAVLLPLFALQTYLFYR